MFRWKFLLPRLIIVVVLVAVVWGTKNQALRWTLINGGQASTGAKVEIKEVQTSIWDGKIVLSGVQVADPNATDQNILETNQVEVNFDIGQLLKKKFVIDRMAMEDVLFSQPRETSGELTDSDRLTISSPFSFDIESKFDKQLQDLESVLSNALVDEFETPKVAMRIISQWPLRYQEINSKVEEIQRKVNELLELSRMTNDNPLRNLERYRRAVTDIATLGQQVNQLYADLDQVSGQLPLDKQALFAAKQRDEKKIQETIAFVQFDGKSLASKLIGEQQVNTLKELVQWVKWARSLSPELQESLDPARRQGEFVWQFDGVLPQPNFLIRELALSGAVDIDGTNRMISGSVHQISSDPVALGKPVVFDVNVDGSTPLKISGTVDRTGKDRIDHFVISCPTLYVPDQSFGSSETLRLAVEPGAAKLKVDLSLVNDEVSGTIRWSQPNFRLDVLEVSESLGGLATHSRLGSSLQNINELSAVIEVAGDLDHLTWNLQSDFGRQLEVELNQAMHQIVQSHVDRLSSDLQQSLTVNVGQLEALIQQQEQRVRDSLQLSGSELARLKTSLASQIGFRLLR